MHVEAITRVMKPQVQKQQVQIPKVTIKALERKVDEPITLMQHRAVQFNEAQEVEYIRQICRPTIDEFIRNPVYWIKAAGRSTQCC